MAYIDVATYGRYGVQRIHIPKSGRSKDLLVSLAKELSMKPSSLHCFSLFVGHLGAPIACLDPADSVKGVKPLCLQRHSLDRSKELKLLATDDVAVHLLFSEALASYRSTSSSRLEPTEEQKELLEEYLDPNFLSERQFLETIINVKGYTAAQISDAKVVRTVIENNSVTLPIDCHVICTCSENYMELKSSSGLCIRWKWKIIKRWRLEEAGKLACFEVTNIKENAHILEKIYIETQQATYLLQMAKYICTNLVYLEDPSKRPIEGPPGILVGRPTDPLYDFVNTALYGSGPKFTELSANKS